ncbi:hypothetical protein [Cytobacillus gottheilii]|uniref:hypothetical protein n=1 Tax=Cytobacillus gottheilii TaxID=859144 RepID=UPI0024944E4E|nr:hypothetical protein [Cytobacillus gottheilii]
MQVEIPFNRLEIACLILHMYTMRDNIKKVLKSNYGKVAGKNHLKTYDEVKQILKYEFELLEEDDNGTQVLFLFEESEFEMLNSFVEIYIEKLSTFMKEAKMNSAEDKEQMDLLQQIKEKIDQEKAVHA